ncbi:hypothetical protein D6C00_11975 [Thiohalobacter thiocyanaticus]|uniref:Uncharacterized protein n=1 Tax=Thiohalobacter thiocyanaticus TaxID=585455 RepID=A0A426QLD6_9GAMM|nr:hypothetical protein D6C00_11975 [Thiohalobacter thiocyanaticus]
MVSVPPATASHTPIAGRLLFVRRAAGGRDPDLAGALLYPAIAGGAARETALDTVARRFSDIRRQYGPEAGDRLFMF